MDRRTSNTRFEQSGKIVELDKSKGHKISLLSIFVTITMINFIISIIILNVW